MEVAVIADTSKQDHDGTATGTAAGTHDGAVDGTVAAMAGMTVGPPPMTKAAEIVWYNCILFKELFACSVGGGSGGDALKKGRDVLIRTKEDWINWVRAQFIESGEATCALQLTATFTRMYLTPDGPEEEFDIYNGKAEWTREELRDINLLISRFADVVLKLCKQHRRFHGYDDE
jgi:hypothetical protein